MKTLQYQLINNYQLYGRSIALIFPKITGYDKIPHITIMFSEDPKIIKEAYNFIHKNLQMF